MIIELGFRIRADRSATHLPDGVQAKDGPTLVGGCSRRCGMNNRTRSASTRVRAPPPARRPPGHPGAHGRPRALGCYSFLRTRSQNPRGSTILMGASAAAISRRSRSPVTNTSARLSTAEATTHRSSESRWGTAARTAGLGATSYSLRNSSISLTVPGGRPIRVLSTRPSSRSTTSPVTRVCSASTTRSTSAQIPRVAKALTKTLVSKKTLKRRRGRHPRPSGIPAPPRTAVLYVGAARISSGSTAAGGHRAQAHFASGRSACRAGQGAFPGQGPAEW